MGRRKERALNKWLLKLCEEAGVKVRVWQYNKNAINLEDLPTLLHYLAESHSPPNTVMGFDRLSLLVWLTGMEKELRLFDGKSEVGKSGYARRMELEIRRIADLRQPARTIAAVELMQRLEDARGVAQVARQYLQDEYGDVLETRYEGGYRWWTELAKLADMVRPIASTDTSNQLTELSSVDSPTLPPSSSSSSP